jgi:hypothetical protein
MLELSKNHKIYRKYTDSFILRSERNIKKLNHFFAFYNYNTFVVIIGSLLISFEYLITVEFNYCVNSIVNY